MVYGWRAPLAHPKGERGELQARQLHTNTALGVGAATRRNTVATPSLMMEVSPSGLAARSQLVSNLAVAQLLVCFLAGLLRPDSFVVAPLVALYAARERDRRAHQDPVEHQRAHYPTRAQPTRASVSPGPR